MIFLFDRNSGGFLLCEHYKISLVPKFLCKIKVLIINIFYIAL